MSAGFNTLASGLIAAVILFIGHSLNLMLGPIAILVHGVRLNVLEFCNHIDIKWTGLSYRPLKEEAGPAVTG
jgi:V/A-type H+-transporting ATPase subunit I